MKYTPRTEAIPHSKRTELNEKALYLIGTDCLPPDITPEDIFNAYTGYGGLHNLSRSDYDSYYEYSSGKKEFENGQFFTPPLLCELLVACLKLSDSDIVADLTCGMGNFFNYMPVESNIYGCENDIKAFKVAHYLYPDANLELKDIRTYQPDVRFDYIVGNPPFNLKWWTAEGEETLSQLYYCLKASQLLKPLGILALIVPQSFLADDFTDAGMIKKMEVHFSFLGQIGLPTEAFSIMGVEQFPTKLQFWQKKSEMARWSGQPYKNELILTLPRCFDAQHISDFLYKKMLMLAKSDLEQNQSRVMLELARQHNITKEFHYQTQKLLYQIKVHPSVKSKYSKCCEYLYRFYTETQPTDMPYKEWCKARLTEKKVLTYLQKTLKQQNTKPQKDVIKLVKQNYHLVYKGYSTRARRRLTESMRQPVPIYHILLDNTLDNYPEYKRLLQKKKNEYENINQPFSKMQAAAAITGWLSTFVLWDTENEEYIYLNDLQKHDINLVLQKNYALLQWEQGSGKTLAGIAAGLYRMQCQHLHSTWVISSAISIRNNWDTVLKNYRLPYVFVESLKDLERIKPGDFVLITLNKVSQYKKHINHWVKIHRKKILFILDESDEISNPSSNRTKAVLACFRRCRAKLLMTGTSTRNNISEFAPQLELLYNNSINMISWCSTIYHYDRKKRGEGLLEYSNPYYSEPIPAYKKGYALFSASHLPEKITVFGCEQRTQDLYNSDILSDILEKTVITRTFEEVSGKNIKRIHQIPIRFCPEEKSVYQKAITEFLSMRDNYFTSTGNSRKDSMMRLIQQITLLLRISAAPDTVEEYTGDIPIKILSVIELAAQWENEMVAIGVRHKIVLDSYAKAIKEFFPHRPLFIVTGSTTTFAKRRALRRVLRESKNGILLCTQQSLPSSVNFEFVNKIIIPELHYNNAAMSQFYSRFIRYTSTEYKDIYFVTYAGSIESNLMQMILSKEKINLFMKGQDVDLDSIYQKFDVNYDLLSMLMYQEKDEKGVFHIRWGEQNIA